MRRANIKIKGNVQTAGFRTFIKNIKENTPSFARIDEVSEI